MPQCIAPTSTAAMSPSRLCRADGRFRPDAALGARALPSHSTRPVRSDTSDESERALRLDSARSSTVEGASNRARRFPVFVKPEVRGRFQAHMVILKSGSSVKCFGSIKARVGSRIRWVVLASADTGGRECRAAVRHSQSCDGPRDVAYDPSGGGPVAVEQMAPGGGRDFELHVYASSLTCGLSFCIQSAPTA